MKKTMMTPVAKGGLLERAKHNQETAFSANPFRAEADRIEEAEERRRINEAKKRRLDKQQKTRMAAEARRTVSWSPRKIQAQGQAAL